MQHEWDAGSIDAEVVICGGGLAGLCAARQLRRELPDARVLLVDRAPSPLPEACHKVGESSVELASHYLGRTLGLDAYLRERHLIKNGLRFLPGGGDTRAVADRTEIGPPEMPVVPSFQIDRGRFENDLRAMIVEDGVDARFGVGVTDVELGGPGEAHVVRLSDGGALRARFVIDASGRRQLIARKLGLRQDNGHLAHAAWFRVEGKCQIDQLVPKEDEAWHRRDLDGIRWLSTTHFMGPGYWVWLIPLSSGYTSVGITVHGELHPFDTIHTLERALAWIAKHEPALRAHLEGYEVADFRCLKSYSYGSSQVFSADRWASVGEAGLFVDPFYSPGSDFIALANGFATQLVRAELSGEPLAPLVEFFDGFYRRTAFIATEVYRQAAPVYGRPYVLAAKIYWDNFAYWSWLCQYFFQDIWRLPIAEQAPFVEMGQRFAELQLKAQHLFAEWARRGHDAPERRHVILPPIPSMLANLHLDLDERMSPAETLAYMEDKVVLARELLADLLLRAVAAVGAEEGRALIDAIGAREWHLPDLPARIEVELGDARSRRRRLSRLARDVERCIGKLQVHESVSSVPEVCGPLLGVTPSAPLHASL
jgi:flavin-dependent dehydrogenase